MKYFVFRLLTNLILMALAFPALAQDGLPPPREVDKEYRKEYRESLREYNRTEKRIQEEGWDFYLAPIESVPTDIVYAEEARLLAYTNWYRDIASPESLAADMVKSGKKRGVILITDTACGSGHPDLQKGKLPGSTYTGEPCGNDVHGHGTHTWGIAALICKPLIDAGYIEVKPVQVLGSQGQGSLASITSGIDTETAWAVSNYLSAGKFVVANASWGGGTAIYTPLKTALEKSRKAGLAWFFAAGNTGKDVNFPGLLDAVSAVSSLDNNMAISSFSSRGPEVDFAAGGRGVYSTYLDGSYASLSGTSMAAPALAGAGAVAMCVWPSLTAETLPGYLAKVAKDLGESGKDPLYGNGAVFVRAILDTRPDSEPEPPTCTDGIKNGKETGVDCGGPDCPPCEPEGPPAYKDTRRLMVVKGKFSMDWYTTGTSAAADDARAARYWDMTTMAMATVADRQAIVITEIGFWVDSKTTYEYEYWLLDANVKRYFRNAAIGTPEGWDWYDRGRYIPYFLDWRAAIGSPGFARQVLTPAVLRYEVAGLEYYISPADLPDWQPE